MRTRIGLTLLLAALLALALPGFASAKGPASRITIVGPGLDGALEIVDDAVLLGALSMAALEDFMRPAEPPAYPTLGFELTRFFETNTGEYVPFDQVVYHPAPDGEPGLVHYLGIVNGSSEYDGRWFHIQPRGERMLREVLSAHGADFEVVAFTVEPYLALLGKSGTLRVIDPATLDTAAAWQISLSEPSLVRATAAPRGDALFLDALGEAGAFGTLRLDLADARACPVKMPGEVVTAAPDGENLIVASGQANPGEAPSGQIEVRHADTLDLGKAIPVSAASAAVQHFPSPDGRYVATLRQDEGTMFVGVFDTYRQVQIIERRLGKVPDGAVHRAAWDSVSGSIYVINGQRAFRLDSDQFGFSQYGGFELVDEDKQPLGGPGTVFEIAGARNGTLYLYRPGETSGILQVGFVLGRLQDRLWTDLAPAQATLHGETIYALAHDETGEASLWALDLASGEREHIALGPGAWRVSLVRLDPAALPSEGGAVIPAGCE